MFRQGRSFDSLYVLKVFDEKGQSILDVVSINSLGEVMAQMPQMKLNFVVLNQFNCLPLCLVIRCGCN